MSVTTQTSERPCTIPPGRSNLAVLVIDDDEDFRALARRVLMDTGFQAHTAGSVSEGLAYMTSHPTAVVILDIVMPGRDGIEGLTAIRTLFPAARIVTVSGTANADLYLSISARMGATASLDKSHIASLGALLRVVLGDETC